MDHLISPFILYIALALGGVGVWLALPRRGVSPQAIGGIVGAAGAGLVILALTISALKAGEGLPNIFFYIFSLIALGASLRVITHPQPVYAALYFILTILASSGLYLILSAEFMAFALVIVYAGAILITYLFVIMLATQAPTEEEKESLAEYDAYSREPLAATVAGFVLLAVLTTMLFNGAGGLPEPKQRPEGELLAQLPGKIEAALQAAQVREVVGEKTVKDDNGNEVTVPDERWVPVLRSGEHVIQADGSFVVDGAARTAQVSAEGGAKRTVVWPEGFALDNAEGVGFNLLNDHPGSIEIAGVILLMAMLGAVVLARKKVQADEEDKSLQVRTLMGGGPGHGSGQGGAA